MNEHGQHAVAVIDLGYFCEIAAHLAPHFARTYYWSPGAASPCRRRNAMRIGTGLEGVQRVDHVSEVLLREKKENLLLVFPDVGMGPDQVWLRREGYRVWGSGMAEELELCRPEAKVYLKNLGFAIGPYKIVKGLPELRAYLKDHPDVYVKSSTRGDFETRYVKNLEYAESWLDEIAHTIGDDTDDYPFVVEQPIKPAVEVAHDGFLIDGKPPKSTLWGIEEKSSGYVGHAVLYANLPEPVLEMNERIAPVLARRKCRSWFGMEARISKKDKVPYVIDPLLRMGSPPNELVQAMIRNLPDIFWYGAEGVVVDPVWSPDGRWGAELILSSRHAEDNRLDVQFPEKLRPYVKLKNLKVKRGTSHGSASPLPRYTVLPQSVKLSTVGAVVAVGKTRQEAIELVKERAKQVEGDGLESDPSCFDKIEESVQELREYGFTL